MRAELSRGPQSAGTRKASEPLLGLSLLNWKTPVFYILVF